MLRALNELLIDFAGNMIATCFVIFEAVFLERD